MKKLFFLVTILCSFISNGQDTIGSPDQDCNCEEQQSPIEQVIEYISQKDTVIPLEINYKLLKVGTGSLSITHVDGKILNAEINGKIKVLGFNENMTDQIDIDRLKEGSSVRYYSNMRETPIVEITPLEIKEKGGSVMLKIKQKYTSREIPLELTFQNGKFIATTNGKKINSLKIYFDLDYGRSIREQNLIGGYISSYKLR